MVNKRKEKIQMFKPYVNEKAIALTTEVLKSGWIGEGPKVRELERRLSEKFGISHLACLNSGTSALHLALVLAGVGKDDEVISTAQTCTATNHPILMQGAKPVFADIKYEDLNMDPFSVRRKINQKTKAIMCVHWAGYPCDLSEINGVAIEYGIPVIEDAAHALGASYHGVSIGNYSDFTCFSFQAIKQFTTGDGGMLAVRNKEDIAKARLKRWFSIPRENRKQTISGEPLYDIEEVGYKYHMNDIAAAIGLGNLEDFDRISTLRSDIVGIYRKGLENVPGIQLLEQKKDRKSGNWLFTMHAKERDNLAKKLKDYNVDSSVVHLRNDKFSAFGPVRDDLPNTEKAYHTLLSLPVHNYMNHEEAGYIVDVIKEGW